MITHFEHIKQYDMPIHYVTQEGLDKLKKELADALAQRPVISAAIAEAREKGDLSENAENESEREAQDLLELRIAKLKDEVANALATRPRAGPTRCRCSIRAQ